jgi:hypothetical protein
MSSYYVKAGGNDANDGLSEQNPFGTLAKAIDSAKSGSIKTITVIGVLNAESEAKADRSFSKDDESVFYIKDSGTVEITIAGKEGAMLRGNTTGENSGKRVVSVIGACCVHFENIGISGGVSHGCGGGLYAAKGAEVALGDGVLLSGNRTRLNGGGAAVAGGTLILSGATVKGNTACGNGGGVYAVKSVFPIVNGEIQNNPIRSQDSDRATIGSVFRMEEGLIMNNTAQYGGGAAISAGTMEMADGVISDNTGVSGGGVYIENKSSFILSGGVIENNRAAELSAVSITPFHLTQKGGGVLADNNSIFKMTGGSIRLNEAVNGGGMAIQINSIFLMTYGDISGNRAQNGGGIYSVHGAIMELSGGEIRGNSAALTGGGIHVDCNSSAIFSGGLISDNTAQKGGGVRIENRITGNTLFEISGGVIADNKALEDGGGISVYADCQYDCDYNWKTSYDIQYILDTGKDRSVALLLMSGGVLEKNTSLSRGGGVSMEADGAFTFLGGSINNNKASVGGGIDIGGIKTENKFLMLGGEILVNIDGGIHFWDGKLNKNGGLILNNTPYDVNT